MSLHLYLGCTCIHRCSREINICSAVFTDLNHIKPRDPHQFEVMRTVLSRSSGFFSSGWAAEVDKLTSVEAFFPLLWSIAERKDVQDEWLKWRWKGKGGIGVWVCSVASLKRCNCSRWHSSDIGNPPSWHGSRSRRVPAVLFVWVYGEPGHQICNQIYYSLSLFIYCFLLRLAILCNLCH